MAIHEETNAAGYDSRIHQCWLKMITNHGRIRYNRSILLISKPMSSADKTPRNGAVLQFPPTNNRLRTSSTPKLMLRCMYGQIVTEPIQRIGSSVKNREKDGTLSTFSKIKLSSDGSIKRMEMCWMLKLKHSPQNVPTEVSADTSDKISMIAILTDLQTQLDGHAKVNQEKCLEVETLKNELSQCKQEIYRIDTQKVKLDLENKVRQEQAIVIQGIWPKRALCLYDADTLLHLTHPPVSIWDSEEALVQQVVSMKKMSEKPGHVRPANGFYEKLNALMFVPQQELSCEQLMASCQ
ncbi:hypothetical protein Tco_0989021 [Tanacetum coccineum]|uniref:Uncharacterized protein n=1 Tax=Tanacetum coccineum TaxID=301880 RepID=A0ABQ5ETY7_9ASTR